MKKIFLSQGLTALVDDEDFERLLKYNWHAVLDGKTYYARSKVGRAYGSPVLMHRFILFGLEENESEIDHINRNGLDNRKENLRLATRQENARNRSAKGYTVDGLGWRNKPYKVMRNGKYIGRFATPEEAQEAYANAG